MTAGATAKLPMMLYPVERCTDAVGQLGHTRGTPREEAVDVIRVATQSKPTAVAGAIAASVRQTNEARVQAIGPMAVNQAMKAIAVACSYLAGDGVTVVCLPSFIEVPVDGGKRTAMRFKVEPR